MRRLNKAEVIMLVRAERYGEVRPVLTQDIDACSRLAAYDLLGQHDAAPGVYWITAAGESALARALSLKVA